MLHIIKFGVLIDGQLRMVELLSDTRPARADHKFLLTSN
jgi:hypothetical protein